LKIFCLTIRFVVFLLISTNGVKALSNSFLPDSTEIITLWVNDSAFYFTSLGDKIFYRKWGSPDTGKNEKVLLILHGIGFHSYPYKKIMNYIDNDCMQVYAMDLRGHGLSGKSKGILESNDKILTDVDKMIGIIREDNPKSNKSESLGYNPGEIKPNRVFPDRLVKLPANEGVKKHGTSV
jgi:hypothetical protein